MTPSPVVSRAPRASTRRAPEGRSAHRPPPGSRRGAGARRGGDDGAAGLLGADDRSGLAVGGPRAGAERRRRRRARRRCRGGLRESRPIWMRRGPRRRPWSQQHAIWGETIAPDVDHHDRRRMPGRVACGRWRLRWHRRRARRSVRLAAAGVLLATPGRRRHQAAGLGEREGDARQRQPVSAADRHPGPVGRQARHERRPGLRLDER